MCRFFIYAAGRCKTWFYLSCNSQFIHYIEWSRIVLDPGYVSVVRAPQVDVTVCVEVSLTEILKGTIRRLPRVGHPSILVQLHYHAIFPLWIHGFEKGPSVFCMANVVGG